MITSFVNQLQGFGAVWVPKHLSKQFILICVSRGIIVSGGIIKEGMQLFTI